MGRYTYYMYIRISFFVALSTNIKLYHMKKQSKSFWLCIALCASSMLIHQISKAQVAVNSASLTYSQNFNTLDTATSNSANLPEGWQLFEYGSSATTVNNQYKGNAGTATTGDTYSYGNTGSTDRALGSVATSGNREIYGVGFRNNTGVNITSVIITYRGEQWRRGTATADTIQFRYSTSALGIADTAAGKWTVHHNLSFSGIYTGSATNAALDGNASGNSVTKSDTIHLNISPADTLLIEWVDKDVSGSDDGLSVDDLSILFVTDAPPIPDFIYITGKSPEGEGIDPAANQLQLRFDHLIAQGSGQVTLHKSGSATSLPITIPSTQVSITDSTATLSGILLENNSRYYVTITAGSFKISGGTISNPALTDTLGWAFATADTVIIRPLTALNESFQDCLDTTLCVFKPFSVAGFRAWQCSATGHNDNSAVRMSGGVTDGISDRNEDWLISRNNFDFSAMTKPELSFWHKRKFTGNVTRSLKISTDYIAGKNPGTASWTTLQVQDMVDDPSEEWMPISDIDLTPYKTTPFFLAFTYSCGEKGAYELSYDDIKVQDETLGILTTLANDMELRIIGEANEAMIRLGITTPKAELLYVRMFDYMGRTVYQTQLKTAAGSKVYEYNNIHLLPGLYIVRLNNKEHSYTAKMMIR